MTQGRPLESEYGKMGKRIDAILSVWNQRDEMSFSEIHKALIKKGVVQKEKYHYKTDRILKWLIKKNVVEKVRRGKYKINIDPLEFRLFNRLSKLREEEDFSQYKLGGWLTTCCELYFLGLPEEISNTSAKFALQILGLRISLLFMAFRELAKEIYSQGDQLSLPKSVIRELMLELPAYYLGSKAGTGKFSPSGMTIEELKITLETMIQALPEHFEALKVLKSRTFKNHMLDELEHLVKMAEKRHKVPQDIEYLLGLSKKKPEHFAVIMTEAEWNFDDEGYKKRAITNTIKEGVENNLSPLAIAYGLTFYHPMYKSPDDKKRIVEVLRTIGCKYLGSRAEYVEEYFRILIACKEVAHLIRLADNFLTRFMSHTDDLIRINQSIDEEESKLTNFKDVFRDYAMQYGRREMVSKLVFFMEPYPKLEELIKKIFPEIAKDVHEILERGQEEWNKIEEKLMMGIHKNKLND